MSFLNLSLGELLGLLGAISAGVVALYLLDKSKRHQVVATLRFWTNTEIKSELKHRRRIQQPWSLLLQLVSLALLLFAIAGPHFGIIDSAGLDHVVILDTSAWMGSTIPGQQGILMDTARAAARAYVRSVPARDRVMVLRADALATPATAFELSRTVIDDAIRESQPGPSALNLEQAIAFAQRAQSLQTERPGEIVLISALRVPGTEAALRPVPSNLRVVSIQAPADNVGLRKIGLKRRSGQSDTWDIFVAVRNYGTRPQTVDLSLAYAQSPAGARRLTLRPDSEEQVEFAYREKTGGWLEARLDVHDAFPGDDRAIVQLPSQTALHVIVYSDDPGALRALFGSSSQVDTTFESRAQYSADTKADVIVLDGFVPPSPPKSNAIYIVPPANQSPVPVMATRSGVKLTRWHTDTPLGEGLRTQDVALESSQIYAPAANDIPVADTDEGALITARDSGSTKLLVFGFHPGRTSMRYQLATPLLIANVLRWMAPGAFRRWELQAATIGTVTVPVTKDTEPATVHVVDDSHNPLPFTLEDGILRFFSGAAGTVHVQMADRELLYSLTLPDVAEASWQVPANVHKGVPRGVGASSLPTEIWPWLAALGGLGLLADWLLYGRSRAVRLRAQNLARPLPWRKAS